MGLEVRIVLIGLGSLGLKNQSKNNLVPKTLKNGKNNSLTSYSPKWIVTTVYRIYCCSYYQFT